MGHIALDAVDLLARMAEAGRDPQEVAAAAEGIAVGWRLDAAAAAEDGDEGAASPVRRVLMVQELRRWCAVASSHYALRWERLCRAGRPEAAAEARRWAEALDQAHRALHLYD